jgi:hypothetical protein
VATEPGTSAPKRSGRRRGAPSVGEGRVMGASRTEGPRLAVWTWREERAPHGLLWFARVVRVSRCAAPFTTSADEAGAIVEGRARLPDAVRAAVAHQVKLHGYREAGES